MERTHGSDRRLVSTSRGVSYGDWVYVDGKGTSLIKADRAHRADLGAQAAAVAFTVQHTAHAVAFPNRAVKAAFLAFPAVGTTVRIDVRELRLLGRKLFDCGEPPERDAADFIEGSIALRIRPDPSKPL